MSELLVLARKAIQSRLFNEKLDISEELKRRYNTKKMVFVTLKMAEELRGCIGLLKPKLLWESVVEQARNAAFNDPRFMPLTKDEFRDIRIEISILTEPEEIKGKKTEMPNSIVIGMDGLLIEKKGQCGLLLPQVFTEYNTTPLQALEMTCEKAGLGKESWKDGDSKLYKFRAEIIKENQQKQ